VLPGFTLERKWLHVNGLEEAGHVWLLPVVAGC